ncbi:unnamed protein product [Mytilus coruscus]|uniref:Uncharacterized protein n=1 Tax=Mytilus coruscus TaxID=42192 RepID=A0A6J8BC88_MYTCO|nr:unnamed protein product [Mytilus coruscus]
MEIETANLRSAETDTIIENGELKLQVNNAPFSNIHSEKLELEGLNKFTKQPEISEHRLFETMKTDDNDTTTSTANENPEQSDEFDKNDDEDDDEDDDDNDDNNDEDDDDDNDDDDDDDDDVDDDDDDVDDDDNDGIIAVEMTISFQNGDKEN